MATKLDGTIMSATVLVPLILALQFGAILVIALLSGSGNQGSDASGDDGYASGGTRYATPPANASRQAQGQDYAQRQGSNTDANVAVIGADAAADEPSTEPPASANDPVATVVVEQPVQEPDSTAETETVAEAAPETVVAAEPEPGSQPAETESAPVPETGPAPAAEDSEPAEPAELAEETGGAEPEAAEADDDAEALRLNNDFTRWNAAGRLGAAARGFDDLSLNFTAVSRL